MLQFLPAAASFRADPMCAPSLKRSAGENHTCAFACNGGSSQVCKNWLRHADDPFCAVPVGRRFGAGRGVLPQRACVLARGALRHRRRWCSPRVRASSPVRCGPIAGAEADCDLWSCLHGPLLAEWTRVHLCCRGGRRAQRVGVQRHGRRRGGGRRGCTPGRSRGAPVAARRCRSPAPSASATSRSLRALARPWAGRRPAALDAAQETPLWRRPPRP